MFPMQEMNPYQQNWNQKPYYNRPYEQPIDTLIRVTGLEGAKAYQMPANSKVALFDASDDIMYVKTTDGAGFPTTRIFRFEEIQGNNSTPDNNYISREEFESFKKEMMEYGKQFIQEPNNKK